MTYTPPAYTVIQAETVTDNDGRDYIVRELYDPTNPSRVCFIVRDAVTGNQVVGHTAERMAEIAFRQPYEDANFRMDVYGIVNAVSK